jgi:tryptophan halogenase
MLAEHFPYEADHMEALAYRYNRILANRFYEILDFINMHYCLTQRTDTEFWKTVQRKEHITDRLQAKLEFWRMKPPGAADFEDQYFMNQAIQQTANSSIDPRTPVDTAGLWNHESYQCILYGMDFMGKEIREKYGNNLPPSQVHPQIFQRLQMAQNKLPPHHLWLKEKTGMQDYPTAAKPAGWI